MIVLRQAFLSRKNKDMLPKKRYFYNAFKKKGFGAQKEYNGKGVYRLQSTYNQFKPAHDRTCVIKGL